MRSEGVGVDVSGVKEVGVDVSGVKVGCVQSEGEDVGVSAVRVCTLPVICGPSLHVSLSLPPAAQSTQTA